MISIMIKNLLNTDAEVQHLGDVGSDEYMRRWKTLDRANTLQEVQGLPLNLRQNRRDHLAEFFPQVVGGSWGGEWLLIIAIPLAWHIEPCSHFMSHLLQLSRNTNQLEPELEGISAFPVSPPHPYHTTTQTQVVLILVVGCCQCTLISRFKYNRTGKRIITPAAIIITQRRD